MDQTKGGYRSVLRVASIHARFGRTVRALRAKAGYSQESFADVDLCRLHLHGGFWERGVGQSEIGHDHEDRARARHESQRAVFVAMEEYMEEQGKDATPEACRRSSRVAYTIMSLASRTPDEAAWTGSRAILGRAGSAASLRPDPSRIGGDGLPAALRVALRGALPVRVPLCPVGRDGQGSGAGGVPAPLAATVASGSRRPDRTQLSLHDRYVARPSTISGAGGVEERWQRDYVTPHVTDQGAALALDPDPRSSPPGKPRRRIQEAVDALPLRQRQVLLLRWQQQASYDEIAETLGISPKTVAIHVGRAIQRLREILAQALLAPHAPAVGISPPSNASISEQVLRGPTPVTSAYAQSQR